MSNFIGLVYATLKNEGVDTKGMSTDEAVAKYNELQEKTGGKSGEKEPTPAENKRLVDKGIIDEKEDPVEKYKRLREIAYNKRHNTLQKFFEEHQREPGFLGELYIKEHSKEWMKQKAEYSYYADMERLEEQRKIDKRNYEFYKENIEKEYKEINRKYILANDEVVYTLNNKEWYEEELKALKENYEEEQKKAEYRVKKDIEDRYREEEYDAKTFVPKMKKLLTILKGKKDWKMSKSPYGDSYYLLPKDEEITWDYKPEGSYRLADHWNFFSRDRWHCRIEDEENIDKLMIRKYENGIYKKVE